MVANGRGQSENPPTDFELVQRMSQRDTAAFEAFYDRYHSRILGFLTGLLPSRGDAEDVSQEAFWQAWSQSDRYDARRGRPAAWLLMMARTRALDQLRRRAAKDPARLELPEVVPVPADELAAQQESHQVARRALEQLPGEQRLVVTMAFFQGHTHQEIAQITTTPLGTVKSRIRLGMQRLRELVEQESAA